MRILLLIAAIALCLQSCNYLNPASRALHPTIVKVESTDIELGKLNLNKPQPVVFKITNTGSSPLVIHQVETSCGCTVPKWTKKPIKPNKSGEVEVTYDAKYPGKFHKTITVFANTDDSPIQLNISGEVEYDRSSTTQTIKY